MQKYLKNKKGPASHRQAKASRGGYTIIETMIAISLFIIIVMAGMTALLNANLLHKKSQSMREVMDNLSFIMEDMSRNLRTGYNYSVNGKTIVFEEAHGDSLNSNDQWTYKIEPPNIWKSTQGGTANSWVQLNPEEVVIDSESSFIVSGALPPPGDSQQPFVTIKLVGKITFKNVETPFSLQTSVSQRLIDI